MTYKQVIFVTALLLYVLFPGNIWGQEKKEAPERKSEISLFLGASSNSNETAFTSGMDYQYRINRVFGVGAILDYAGGDLKSLLVAPTLFLHVKQVSFIIAPGVEFSSDEAIFALRLGTSYEFEFSRFSIKPAIFYDTERNEDPTWVYGLSFSLKL